MALNEPLTQQPDGERVNSGSGLQRALSHRSVPESEAYAVVNGAVPHHIKNDFIKKVYAILCMELLLTTGICALFMYWAPLREASLSFVVHFPWTFQITMAVSMIASLCALSYKKNHYPQNYALLIVFVSVMSCMVGVVCAMYHEAGLDSKLLEAFAITALIFILLSAYAHISKTDFSFMGGFLFVAVFVNMIFGFIAMITGSPFLHFIYAIAGVLIFSGYILYDTSNIIHKFGPDDVIIASIELYLDIINVFLFVLQLLGDGK